MKQDALIRGITSALQSDAKIQGAWLGGSFGRGDADAWSDVDVYVLTGESDVERVFDRLASLSSKIAPILYSKRIPHSGTLNFITTDWQRFDFTVVSRAYLERMTKAQLKVLFDRTGMTDRLPDGPGPLNGMRPDQLTDMVEKFIRITGLLPVAHARNEIVVGQIGTGLLRDLLIRVMVGENEGTPVRGMMSLSQSLSEDQMSALMRLPVARPDWQSIFDVNKAVAEAFFPRARALAARIGAEWPTEFERVTLSYLKDTLSYEFRWDG